MVELLERELASDASQNSLAAFFPDESRADGFLREVGAAAGTVETDIEVGSSSEQPRVYRLNARLVAIDGEQPRIDGLLEDVTRRKQSEAAAKQAAIAAARIAMLSPRERDVLREVVAGNANKVTARRLDISEKTVEKHRSSLMKKLGLRSVAEVVRLAVLAESSSR
jgi:DNA-binding CsgD family transcriptional regulator